MMTDNEVRDLLKKFRQGTADEAEKALLESWYLQKENNPAVILTEDEFREDLQMIGNGLPLLRKVRKLRPWPRIAAAAAVLAVLITVYAAWPSHKGMVPVALNMLAAPPNQKQVITLADGSKIWVHAGSSLQYPALFNGNTREVYLSGEAYFDIHHDASKPFIIHTGLVTTTVLGTAFDIKEDKQMHTVAVTVTRGKVRVAKEDQTLGIITPNQQLSYNLENNKSTREVVDADKVIAWQKTDLQFNDVTLAEAAAQLEHRYGVSIHFSNDRIKKCRFSGATQTGESLDEILQVIGLFNNVTCKKDTNGNITISGTGCDQSVK